jgi:hypothetical protein
MNLEKLDEIYKALKVEDDRLIEGGQRVSSLPSSILVETLIRCGSKEYAIALLRHISARLEKVE